MLCSYIRISGEQTSLNLPNKRAREFASLIYIIFFLGGGLKITFGRTQGCLQNTGLYKMIVGVLTTCHTQYT